MIPLRRDPAVVASGRKMEMNVNDTGTSRAARGAFRERRIDLHKLLPLSCDLMMIDR